MTKDAETILELVNRLNFGVRQIFNVAILGEVDKLISLQKWIQENKGPCEIGYICVNGIKSSGLYFCDSILLLYVQLTLAFKCCSFNL